MKSLFSFLILTLIAPPLMADAEDVTPPVIEAAFLKNSEVAAGENLGLYVVAKDEGSGILENSGSGIYLGMIVQNVFKNAEFLNRSPKKVQGDLYHIHDLVLNRWAFNSQEQFTLEQIFVSDQAGNMAILWNPSEEAPYYYDQRGKPTTIRVIRFKLKPNPLGDNQAPTIHSISTDKKVYQPKEKVVITLKMTDNLSGFDLKCCYGFNTSVVGTGGGGGYGGLKLTPTAEPGTYQINNLFWTDGSTGDIFISSFGAQDDAGNWRSLVAKEDSVFYQTAEGVLTNIPVVRIHIVP